MTGTTASKAGAAAGTMIVPLALAQFIAVHTASAPAGASSAGRGISEDR